MKNKLKFLFLGALLSAPFASAQISLNNFSAFESPNTFFTGDWELTGDVGGTNSPRSTFSQGAGFYNFAGGSNSDTASTVYFFDAPVDITGYSLLQVSARLLGGDTAPTLTISLFDSLGDSAFAVVSTSAFAGPGFVTLDTALIFSPGFDATDLSSFSLSGNVVGGSDTLSISLNQLSVAMPRVATPVPEPSTYGILMSVLIAAAVFTRRLRRQPGAA